MVPEKRIEWVEWFRKRGIEISMTRTQTELADYILADEKLLELLGRVGDSVPTIAQIQYWIKSK